MNRTTALLLALFCLSCCKTVEKTFNIDWFTSDPDGISRQVLGVNGQYPGPAIIADIGDTIRVTVNNLLNNDGTSIHWHGLEQRGTPYMDGVVGITQCAIPAGKTFIYEFNVTEPGTFWYHSHKGSQYADGLLGPLIVQDPNDPFKSQYEDEFTIVLSDWYHELSEELLKNFIKPEGVEPMPESALINGLGQYNCSNMVKSSALQLQATNCNSNKEKATFTVKPGSCYRLRLINAAAIANFHFSIDGHNMSVIEADGTYVTPHSVDVVYIGNHRKMKFSQLGIGQRYSVILCANNEVNNYWIRSEIFKTDLPFNMSDASMDHALGILNYEGSEPSEVPIPDRAIEPLILHELNLHPMTKLSAPGPVTRKIYLYVNFTDDPIDNSNYSHKIPLISLVNKAFVNNISFINPEPAAIEIVNSKKHFENYTQTRGEIVEVIVINQDFGEHPIHIHGHTASLIGSGKDFTSGNWENPAFLNLENPLRRDVFIMPQFGWAVFRFEVNNPGAWFFHCVGFAVAFIELEDEIGKPPQSMIDMCKWGEQGGGADTGVVSDASVVKRFLVLLLFSLLCLSI